MTIVAALLPDGRRLHLQHGPIDLVIEAFGAPSEVAAAYQQAARTFQAVLPDLVNELRLLRQPLSPGDDASMPTATGTVAQSMIAACWRYRRDVMTPMAAVAGAVADHILSALLAGRQLAKAYVNNGGDIALFLADGQIFDCGLVTDLATPRLAGVVHVTSSMAVGGIATSGAPGKGRGGRSFSLGIADAVTILAKDAATADAAATAVANAVDLPDHAGIERIPAISLDPDSDLGDRLVTVAVPVLKENEVAAAIERGRRMADDLCQQGVIMGAIVALQGEIELCGILPPRLAAA
jgi:hypothetical protein